MSAYLLGTGFRADMGTCARKLVLLKLIDACEDDGTRIFPAIATVARAAQCSTRQVQREIRAFLDAGLLSLVRAGGRGRRSTNEYAMDLDVLSEISRVGWAAYMEARGLKGDTVSPLDDEPKGDTGDTDRVTPETAKGDSRSHTTPPDSSLEPSSERERARENPDSGEEGRTEAAGADAASDDKADTPGTAAFEKRVARFCNGTGFLAGPWEDWDTTAFAWIAARFADLSSAERAEAERWRDAYLLDLAARRQPKAKRGPKPQPVGTWLRDRMWTRLDPAILQRAEKARAARLKPDEQARPDGWAACMGPVGMAWLFARLIDGPADAQLAARAFLTDPQLREAWPAVWWWQASLRQKGGAVFPEAFHALKAAMEPVPRDTAVLEAWRAEFEARGWRWLNAFDSSDVVYCPKGGPEGLAAFAEMVGEKGNEDADGGPRQAAE